LRRGFGERGEGRLVEKKGDSEWGGTGEKVKDLVSYGGQEGVWVRGFVIKKWRTVCEKVHREGGEREGGSPDGNQGMKNRRRKNVH